MLIQLQFSMKIYSAEDWGKKNNNNKEKENKNNKKPVSTRLGLAESRLSPQARGTVLSPALPKQEHPAPWIPDVALEHVSHPHAIIQSPGGALGSGSPPGCSTGSLHCPPACLPD